MRTPPLARTLKKKPHQMWSFCLSKQRVARKPMGPIPPLVCAISKIGGGKAIPDNMAVSISLFYNR
jgi:hypothetical protein